MNNRFKKVHIWKYVLIVSYISIAQLFCSVFGENFEPFTSPFAPPSDISSKSEQIELAKTNSPILLDSSQILPQEFNVDFPSPSEYKRKVYTVTDNKVETKTENTDSFKEDKFTEESENSVFSPLGNSQNILQHSKTENAEIQDANTKQFKTFDELPSPSKYKIMLKSNDTSPVPSELIPEFSYQAEINNNTTNYIADDIAEGRVISSIKITGNKKINSDLILNEIKSTKGTLFNTEILKTDLQRIYALGYFTENISIEPDIQKDGSVELIFNLEENVIVKDIEITGNTVYPTSELMPMLKSLKNMPQNIEKINESIKNINEYYQKDGYILAHVDSVDDNKDGVLIINISEGIIEKFEFNEDKKTKDYVIERNLLTKPGSIYNESILKQDVAKLYATQIFEDVERVIEPSPDKKGEYIVKINVKEASSNNVSIGAGIDSALGLFGQLSVNEKNFLGRGQFLGASGMIGSGIMFSDSSIKNRMNYNFELNFREPYFLNADNSLSAKIYYRELGSFQIPLAIERRLGVNGVITHKVNWSDKVRTSFGAGYEYINLKEGDRNKITSVYNKRNISMSKRSKQLEGGSFINFSPSITYTDVDDEFMPRKGMIAKIGFTESIGLSEIKNTNGRVVGKITKYIPVFKKSTVSLTARGGIKAHGDMPEIMAFSLGGPYSIRGFRMSGVGTGESFIMGSAELQTPIPFFDRFKYDILKNMRFAMFADAGKIYDATLTSKLYDRPLSAITAGVGLRVYIPGIGPLSIDYAIPFTHTGQYNPNGGYFTFGTSGIYDNY